jgi:hypothetical protein
MRDFMEDEKQRATDVIVKDDDDNAAGKPEDEYDSAGKVRVCVTSGCSTSSV